MSKMMQAPVYFTIAQVRFSPVLTLDTYIPKIQDELRRRGFPDFQKGALTTFNLAVINPGQVGMPQVPVSQAARYIFLNMQKTAAFILDEAALSFQTTAYDVFESFSGTFLMGLKVVHEAVTLSYTDRIGVRYLDAVHPTPGEDLADYLNGAVLGLYGRLKGVLVHTFSETVVKNGPIAVIARNIVQEGKVGLPPDLLPSSGLVLGQRFQDIDGLHAILDTDGSYEDRTVFDLIEVSSRLDSVHTAIESAFAATITERAIRAWK